MTFWKRMVKGLLPALGWLFAFSPPSVMNAAPSNSFTVTITPQDVQPPSAITNLTASAGAIGQLYLEWTAPDENNYAFPVVGPAASYQVKIATYSADSIGNTTTWWNNAQDVTGEPTPSAPGTLDSLLLNNLPTGVTYYAAIKSFDINGNISLIDTKTNTPNQQARAFLPNPSGPPTPTNFVGVALSTTSIRWTWNAAAAATFYTLNAFPSGALILQTTELFAEENGFTPNTPVSRTLRAANGNGLSNPTVALTVYTHAAIPLNPIITNVGFTTISLAWNANQNPSGTQYRVERSPDGTNFSGVNLTTNLNFTDINLAQLTTYYYRVVAFNGDGIVTTPSVVISTITRLQQDFMPPGKTLGFKGTLDSTGQAFTLIWEPITQNQDGTPITDLAGYNIYRRTTPTGTPTKLNNSPITLTAYADQVNNQVYYYTIRAIDTSGNEATEEPLLADSSREANIIYIGPDGMSSLFVPDSVNNLLRSSYNQYGVPLYVRLDEEPLPSNTEIIRSIRLNLVRGDNNQEVSDLAFERPNAVVSVAYDDVGGQVGRGAPSGSSTNASAVTTPDRLSLYWHNGVTWVKVGGTLDVIAQALRVKSSFLGTFQLRATAQATSLTLESSNVYPRVFTPNGDGHNDTVYFVVENPLNSSVRGEILDLKGRRIRMLPGPSNSGIGTTLSWDGKDDGGNLVPGGAYIYKIQGEGKNFTGTVAVAR